MYFKLFFYLISLFNILILSSCSTDNLLAKKHPIQTIENIEVKYILPKDAKKSSGKVYGIVFSEYTYGPDSRIERLNICNTVNGFQIERRTDNGVAGSGVIYNVEMKAIPREDGIVVTFIPRTQKSYEEGLILPFPIPDLNIESYLLDTSIDYRFELESEYPPASVQANFDRLLNKNYSDSYNIDIPDVEAIRIKVSIYPYRNDKSKIDIHAFLSRIEANDNVVDVVKTIAILKNKILNIINS